MKKLFLSAVLALVACGGPGGSDAGSGGGSAHTGGGSGATGGGTSSTGGGTSSTGGGAGATGGGSGATGGGTGATGGGTSATGGGSAMGGGSATGGGSMPTMVTLTVTNMAVAPASGSVTSMPSGITCGNTCMMTYASGTSVTLTATAGTKLTGAVWSGACAGSFDTCTLMLTQDTQITVTFSPYNVIFATSGLIAPKNLGGLSGADAICQMLATDAGLLGTFKAWLGSDAGFAQSRFDAGVRGWVRPDGRPFADSMASLLNGQVLYPPMLDEHGKDVSFFGTAVFPNTTAFTGQYGTIMGAQNGNCGNWTLDDAKTIVSGIPGGGTNGWTAGFANNCDAGAHYYCLGNTYAVPAHATATGRIAFLTVNAVRVMTDISQIDAQCTDMAHDAGLPGSYRAFLPTTTASAGSRFDGGGPIWVRLDGVALVADAGDIAFDPTHWTAALNVTTKLEYEASFVMTGGSKPTSLSTQTCGDWTNPNGDAGYGIGDTAYATGDNIVFPTPAGACTTGRQAYCLQQ